MILLVRCEISVGIDREMFTTEQSPSSHRDSIRKSQKKAAGMTGHDNLLNQPRILRLLGVEIKVMEK